MGKNRSRGELRSGSQACRQRARVVTDALRMGTLLTVMVAPATGWGSLLDRHGLSGGEATGYEFYPRPRSGRSRDWSTLTRRMDNPDQAPGAARRYARIEATQPRKRGEVLVADGVATAARAGFTATGRDRRRRNLLCE